MVLRVSFSTAVTIAWPGLIQSYLSSSDPTCVFAVQFGFSALLCSSAILTLESISPVSMIEMFLIFYFVFFLIISVAFVLHLRNIFHLETFFFFFWFVGWFSVLKTGTCEHFPLCKSLNKWHHVVLLTFKIITMLIKLFSDSSIILSSRCHWDIRLKKQFFDMITDLKYWYLEICCK